MIYNIMPTSGIEHRFTIF